MASSSGTSTFQSPISVQGPSPHSATAAAISSNQRPCRSQVSARTQVDVDETDASLSHSVALSVLAPECGETKRVNDVFGSHPNCPFSKVRRGPPASKIGCAEVLRKQVRLDWMWQASPTPALLDRAPLPRPPGTSAEHHFCGRGLDCNSACPDLKELTFSVRINQVVGLSEDAESSETTCGPSTRCAASVLKSGPKPTRTSELTTQKTVGCWRWRILRSVLLGFIPSPPALLPVLIGDRPAASLSTKASKQRLPAVVGPSCGAPHQLPCPIGARDNLDRPQSGQFFNVFFGKAEKGSRLRRCL